MEVLLFWCLLLAAMMAGVQVGFALAVGGFGLIFVFADGLPWTGILSVMTERMYESSNTFTLLALPLFFLAGGLMDAGGISTRLVNFAMVFVGWIRGGLSMVVVVAEMFLSGISGSASADAAALGGTMIPAMKRRGYSAGFSAALVASAGALGPIIPPSIGMVVYGAMADVSISRLFVGGLLPGLLFGIGLMSICYIIAKKRNYPTEGSFPTFSEVVSAFRQAALPLLAPVIILGGIFTGVFTATESAMIAVLYGLIVSKYVYRTITWREALEICYESALGSARVMFIIATAAFVAWILARLQIPQKVAESLLAISENKYVILLLINALLLFLGCFLEGLAIMIIMVPTLVPLLNYLQVDLVFFGVLLVINLAIGTVTPPIGVSLIVTSSIANVPFENTFRELIPFVGIMVVMLVLLIVFPGIVLWLPNLVFG